MNIQTIQVKTRVATGNGPARQLRATGQVPCILYGGDVPPLSLSMDARKFAAVVHGRGGEHAVVKLDVEDNPALSSAAMVKDVQHHPLRGTIVHADFMRINLEERITAMVAVNPVGQARGVIEGGVLEHSMREIEVECLAMEVPESLAVDISGLDLGDSFHVRDLVVPAGVTVISDPDRTIVAVLVPRSLKEAGSADGEESATPEVITERKKDKDA